MTPADSLRRYRSAYIARWLAWVGLLVIGAYAAASNRSSWLIPFAALTVSMICDIAMARSFRRVRRASAARVGRTALSYANAALIGTAVLSGLLALSYLVIVFNSQLAESLGALDTTPVLDNAPRVATFITAIAAVHFACSSLGFARISAEFGSAKVAVEGERQALTWLIAGGVLGLTGLIAIGGMFLTTVGFAAGIVLFACSVNHMSFLTRVADELPVDDEATAAPTAVVANSRR